MKKSSMRVALLLFGACIFLATAGSLVAGPSRQENQMGSPIGPSLDYEYFKTMVEPIFLAKRPGHARCITCHSINSAALHVVPLSPGADTWNDEESRKNFELIKRVAIPGDLTSPLLIHPLAESAGGDLFHSGGKHFSSQSDPEWLILKAFVMGQKAQ
jgi:hypothetical protein